MAYAKPVASFADIEDEFIERVHAVVWCAAATVDTRNRPRSRVWHPIWEANTGRIATNRNTLKTKHRARNPYLSLSYLDHRDVWNPLYVDCRAEWDDTAEGKRRTWEMYVSAPEPLGYDPAGIWGTVENPEFGVLMLRPWRVELVDGPGSRAHGGRDLLGRGIERWLKAWKKGQTRPITLREPGARTTQRSSSSSAGLWCRAAKRSSGHSWT